MAEAAPQFLRDMRRDRTKHEGQRLHGGARCTGRTVGLSQVVDVLNELCDGRVVTQLCVIGGNPFHGAVEGLEVVVGKRCVRDGELTGVLIDHQAPSALEEALRAD